MFINFLLAEKSIDVFSFYLRKFLRYEDFLFILTFSKSQVKSGYSIESLTFGKHGLF